MSMYSRDEMRPEYQPETEESKEQEMNFQEARNLEGQKNAKGYQQGVSMTGTIVALVDPQRIFTTNGKPTQRIQLLDDLGESCKVKVFLGNGPDILAADVRTVQSFSDLAMNRYKNNVTYMAFWDNMHPPQAAPPQQQPYTPPPQASPQQQSYTPPPQAPSPQQQQAFNREMEQPKQPDWDEIARGKVRCNLVCAVLQSGENPDIEYLNGLMDFIFTGNTGGGANPDWVGEDPPPPTEDDVPF